MAHHAPPIDVTIEGIRGMLGQCAWFIQSPHEGAITIQDEDHATGRWIMSERAKPAPGDGGHFNHGIYLDHYVREAGQWKFARREYNYLYLDESAPTGQGVVHSREELERLQSS